MQITIHHSHTVAGHSLSVSVNGAHHRAITTIQVGRHPTIAAAHAAAHAALTPLLVPLLTSLAVRPTTQILAG